MPSSASPRAAPWSHREWYNNQRGSMIANPVSSLRVALVIMLLVAAAEPFVLLMAAVSICPASDAIVS